MFRMLRDTGKDMGCKIDSPAVYHQYIPSICCCVDRAWGWRCDHHLLAQGFGSCLARRHPAHPLTVRLCTDELPEAGGQGAHQLPQLIISQQIIINLQQHRE